jgi:monooxygenase
VLVNMGLYLFGRWQPAAAKKAILRLAREHLGPGYDIDRDFSPRYNPWDQRLCLAADGDFFAALRAGRASVVTGEVETFTATGVRLRSGDELPADIVVTATGLSLRLMGGIDLIVDGVPVEPSRCLVYKGMLLGDVPNLCFVFGYINASWTLKAELASEYACRLLNYMDRHGYTQATPRPRDPAMPQMPMLSFTSGYVQRAAATLPHQGSRRPWKLYQNYLLDLLALRYGFLTEGPMEFPSH